MDWLIILWAACLLTASIFHKNPSVTLITNLGNAYNAVGIFFLIRCFCQSEEDVKNLIKVTALLLIPVALEMLNEQLTHRNAFSIFGGVSEIPVVREGRIRAQGPFRHSILAGTVGAVCMPLMAGIWRSYPVVAKSGIAACLAIVVACASSGPILSLAIGIIALFLWRWRHQTKSIRMAAIGGYIFLEMVMKNPAYFLMARMDIVGGSAGWHRARLIQSAIEHLGEWWFAGTDYTRHWMPTGVPWSPDHTDITNHYLGMGVDGGLALMLIFILTIWFGFRYIGETLTAHGKASFEKKYLAWALGSSLITHAVTMISVGYFDQSFLFLYINFAIIAAIHQHFGNNEAATRLSADSTDRRAFCKQKMITMPWKNNAANLKPQSPEPDYL
jgi:transcription antitermination factor NusG